jgi:hypothetical protein
VLHISLAAKAQRTEWTFIKEEGNMKGIKVPNVSGWTLIFFQKLIASNKTAINLPYK